jgi:hypothetical protein
MVLARPKHYSLLPISVAILRRFCLKNHANLLNSGNQSKQVGAKLKLSNHNKPRLPLGRTVIQFVFASANCSSEILALVRLAPHRLAPRRLALLR